MIGEVRNLAHTLPPMQVHKLADEDAVAAAYVRHLAKQGRIETLVIANPNDFLDNPQPMSPLAPWIALAEKRAAAADRRGRQQRRGDRQGRRPPGSD